MYNIIVAANYALKTGGVFVYNIGDIFDNQLISKRYEKSSIIFTSNKSYGQWGEIFQDNVIASAVLDRILHHCTTINIKGESYRLKDRRKLGLQTGKL